MKLIVEFRLITGSGGNDWQLIAQLEVVEAPLPGEIVGVNGEPYLVVERSWAFSDRDLDGQPCQISVAYLRVSRLQSKGVP